MHSFLQLGLLLGLLLLAAANVSAETVFRRPPAAGPPGEYRDNPVYELGQEIELLWEMDFDSADILMWQKDIGYAVGDNMHARVVADTKSTTYTWNVSYDGFSPSHDPSLSNVYYFVLYEQAKTDGQSSHYFNITEPENASATSASATATDTSSNTATANKATAVSDADDDGGLPSGTLAAIVVGSVIGGLLVLGGLGFLLWRHLRGGNGGAVVSGARGDDTEVATSFIREPSATVNFTP